MPKTLFYIGTGFCLFLALSSAAAVGQQLEGGGGAISFAALRGHVILATGPASWAIIVALLITAPSIVPFVQFLGRSGYLSTRATLSSRVFFPPWH